jgi:myo-inositol-1(or 4)-monophosphatase
VNEPTDNGELGLDLDALLAAAVVAAQVGGAVVRESFGNRGTAIRAKGPGDWVSDIDTASETAVRASLARDAPGVAFFGEELGGDRADVGWLVDPLDGTANFLHGFPIVGVSIGLVVRGEPVVGVVNAPMLGDVYTARRGGGAFCNGERLSVSTRPLGQAICATGFPFRAKRERLGEYLPVFEAALVAFEDMRRAGAASLDLAWTAAGVFDGYFEQALGPWDVAAGALLVREAGGRVTDWSGDERAWLTSGDVVVGGPEVHARILELAATAGRP